MREKLLLVASIFQDPLSEKVGEKGDNSPLQHGNYYGGVYNGKKYMYSQLMIETLPIEKLEQVIRNQIGI